MLKEFLVSPIATSIIVFVLAFLQVFFVIPNITKIVITRKLNDIPDQRSSHKAPTPTMGGVAFFFALIFSLFLIQKFDTEQVAPLLATVKTLAEWLQGHCGPIETAKKLASKDDPGLPYELLYRATTIAQRQQFLVESKGRGVFQDLIDLLASNWSIKALSNLADQCAQARALSGSSNNLNVELSLEHFLMGMIVFPY